MSRVAVVGLGKLGAVMAAVFADAGHIVVGVDTNANTVAKLRAGVAPVDEPGLQRLIDNNRQRLVAVDDVAAAVGATDIAFLIVPTPSKEDGFFDHTIVLEAAMEIGNALRESEQSYTVVVSSTVMPGTCQNAIQPALDAAAGRHIPLCYSPEFIALGSVIDNMHYPDMVLVGADDLAAGEALIDVIGPVTADSYAPYVHLSLIDAELAKISVNSFVTMKISFANQMAAICEGIPGADSRRVLRAIGRDSRIGTKYLLPGGPYGGPCFPRDNRAFQAMAERSGADAPLAIAADVINEDVVVRIMTILATVAIGDLAILGMTYKPDTVVRTESLGSRLSGLCEHDALTHDPSNSTRSAQDVVDRVDHVVIATAWPEYSELDYSRIKTVVDVWNILADAPNVHHLGVGA